MASFFFPPLGGSAVQRVSKFAEYLPRFGYRPMVVTVKNWHSYIYDYRVVNGATVMRTGFLDISRVLSVLDKIMLRSARVFIERNMLLPDGKIGWLPLALMETLSCVRKGCDLIWTTSPPETAHILGLIVNKLYGIPWVVDFRNEWTQNPAYTFPTKWSMAANSMLEDKVINLADKVCTLSPAHTDYLVKHYKDLSKFHTIENGFDRDEIKINPVSRRSNDSVFTITHIGSFYGVQMPYSFIDAINSLVEEGEISADCIKIRFIGNLWDAKDLVNSCKIKIETQGYIPHKDVYSYMLDTDILLVTLTKNGGGVLPGKIYEYIAVGKPILAVVPPEGEVAKLIGRTNTGVVASTVNKEDIKNAIMGLYSKWRIGRLSVNANLREIDKYQRINLTKQLADIFDEVLYCNSQKRG